ncbi:hypothetical protein L1887_30515 [Cichorium endivia]|nr:hypothetical protein L1887_30515 [Cichorium endivia]
MMSSSIVAKALGVGEDMATLLSVLKNKSNICYTNMSYPSILFLYRKRGNGRSDIQRRRPEVVIEVVEEILDNDKCDGGRSGMNMEEDLPVDKFEVAGEGDGGDGGWFFNDG